MVLNIGLIFVIFFFFFFFFYFILFSWDFNDNSICISHDCDTKIDIKIK